MLKNTKIILEELFSDSPINNGASTTKSESVVESESAVLTVVDSAVGQSPTQQLLYAYIEAELDGRDAAKLYADVHRQLTEATFLRAQYEDLKDILILERQGSLIQPPVQPKFDFSYLRELQRAEAAVDEIGGREKESIQEESLQSSLMRAATKVLDQAWRLDEVGHVIIEFSNQLLENLAPPPPQLVPLKSGETDDRLCYYELKQDLDDLEVEIAAKSLADDPDHCHVAVEVIVPSRGAWPNQANSVVILKRGQEELQTCSTDAWGKILFDPIDVQDLAKLAFEIQPVGLLN